MTVDEKREAVNYYCGTVKIKDCVLNNKEWEHESSNCCGTGKCLLIESATEAELDRALKLIAGAPKPCVEPEVCVEPAADDAEIVIKIMSSRKINCLHIEFAKEE